MTEELTESPAEIGIVLEPRGIDADLRRRLVEMAERLGVAPADFVVHLVRREIEQPTMDEILAPVRQGFTESEFSGDELITLFEKMRDEDRAEQQREGNG